MRPLIKDLGSLEIMVEILKDLSELCLADERQKLFVADFDEVTGACRHWGIEDVYHEAASIELSVNVPDKIKSHFATALNLLVYSWFYYPFNVTAQFMAYTTVELALKEKYGVKRYSKKSSFRTLLDRAVKDGLIKSKGFSHIQNKSSYVPYLGAELHSSGEQDYCDVLVEALPYLRNQLAHGSPMLHPNGGKSVRICSELINQLFES